MWLASCKQHIAPAAVPHDPPTATMCVLAHVSIIGRCLPAYQATRLFLPNLCTHTDIRRYEPGPGLPLETIPLEPADVKVSPEGRLDVRYYIERDVQVMSTRDMSIAYTLPPN